MEGGWVGLSLWMQELVAVSWVEAHRHDTPPLTDGYDIPCVYGKKFPGTKTVTCKCLRFLFRLQAQFYHLAGWLTPASVPAGKRHRPPFLYGGNPAPAH